MPRFGLPGMGSGTSALLAEMRQKKAAKPAVSAESVFLPERERHKVAVDSLLLMCSD